MGVLTEGGGVRHSLPVRGLSDSLCKPVVTVAIKLAGQACGTEKREGHRALMSS